MADESIITLRTLLGHVAMWAVRQSPYTCPDGLADVLEELRNRADLDFRDGVTSFPMWRCTPDQLRAFLDSNLKAIKQVQAWNQAKADPAIQYAFVTRCSRPDPDHGFIDLDALVMNIVRSVFDEDRQDQEFYRRFEESLAPGVADTLEG